MKLNRLALSLLFVATSVVSAQAACIGSGSLKSCYDSSGNSYTVSKFGNTTITNGYNSRTGSTWSQNSTSFGNTTLHNGQAANGNSWNMTQHDFGNGYKTFNGTNSQGNSFSYSCTSFGCN